MKNTGFLMGGFLRDALQLLSSLCFQVIVCSAEVEMQLKKKVRRRKSKEGSTGSISLSDLETKYSKAPPTMSHHAADQVISSCGDHFSLLPQHQRIQQLRLRRTSGSSAESDGSSSS